MQPAAADSASFDVGTIPATMLAVVKATAAAGAELRQVPIPEPLRHVERSVAVARGMHAEADYARMWLALYEDVVRNGEVTAGAGYPVLVNGRFVMAPSPIPRWDIPKLDQAETLFLFGAGREK